MSAREAIRRARMEAEIAPVKQGKLDAHAHRVVQQHQPGQLIVDAEGDVVMQDVIKNITDGRLQKAVDSLGVYCAKYKEQNPFL